MTRLGPDVRPLAKVTVGVGNGDGTEGAYAGKVVGTYLHGPVLVRNPGLADLLLSWAAGPLPPLAPAVPARVVTTPDGVISRMSKFLSSETNTLPLPSTAIPAG